MPVDASDTPLIEGKALTKRFGRHVVVDGIDFEVPGGEVFGFLGPNGAGKTTTMRMIACVSPRSDGDLRVLDMDPSRDGRRIRARLGVVPQENNLDLELTVADNLLIYGRYFGLPRRDMRQRVDELLQFAQLSDRRDSRVEPLSGGMKRRLTIARALVNRPELVLLDEPTTGLDPQARHLLWERLYRLKREGVTLVLTTHYMDEAEQLCDRLVIMDDGRIVAEGSPRELIERHATREVVELRFATPADQDAALARLDGRWAGGAHAGPLAEAGPLAARSDPSAADGPSTGRVEPLADRLLVYTDDGDRAIGELATVGVDAASTLVRRSSLEDVFLTLTGRSLDE